MISSNLSNIGIPAVDPRYQTRDQYIGEPNIIMHEAVFNAFHRFDILNPGTTPALSYTNLSSALDDEYDLDYFWQQYSNIIASFASSRNVITKAEFVDYLQQVCELSSHIHTLLGLKLIYDLDWRAVFGEERPREITMLGNLLALDDVNFEYRYSNLLREASNILMPKVLVDLIALLHSPFSLPTSDSIHIFVSDLEVLPVMVGTPMQTSFLDLIEIQLDLLSTSNVYSRVRDVMHVGFLAVPCFTQPTYLTDGNMLLHMNGLCNRYASNGVYISDSPFETNDLVVSNRNVFFKADTGNPYSAVNYNTSWPLMACSNFYTGVMSISDLYIFDTVTEPTLLDHLFTPFIIDKGAYNTHYHKGYNLGLVNYGPSATIDSLGYWIMLPALSFELGGAFNNGSSEVNENAFSRYMFWRSGMSFTGTWDGGAPIAVNFGTKLDKIRREETSQFTTSAYNVTGIFFDYVIRAMLESTGVSALQNDTKLSQVRTTNQRLDAVKQGGRRKKKR